MRSLFLFILFAAVPGLLCAQSVPSKTASPAAKKTAVSKAPAKKAAVTDKKAASKTTAPVKKRTPAPVAVSTVTVAVSTAPAVDPFAEALEKIKSEDEAERRAAADRLGKFRDPKAAPALIAVLSDRSPLVRQTAVDALGLLTWRESVPRLSEILLKDDTPSVRQQAAISLSYMADQRSGPALVQALADESPSVRYAVMHTIGVIKYLPAEKEIAGLLDSKDTNTRRGAIAALGQMQAAGSGKAIAAALEDKEPMVRMEAVKAVGDIGYAPAAPELVKLLVPENTPQLRIAAALALSKMGMNDGLTTAYEFIKAPEMSVRNQAMNVIVAVGDARSLKFIEEVWAAESDPAKKNMLDFARQRLSVRLNQK